MKDWWVKYPERYNPRGKVPTNIWGFQIPIQGGWSKGYLRHFCPFPKELVERIILLTTNKNNVVLDPFSGSGIVLAVAKCLQRRYIGFELNKDYIERFETGVLPQIKKEMRNRRQEMSLLYRKKIKKIEEIKKLRQLKYPKTLIKEILKEQKLANLGSFPINTIFIISERLDKNDMPPNYKTMKEKIYLIFDSYIDKENLRKDIEIASNRPPLSKFGIIVNFYISEYKDFVEKQEKNHLFDGSRLFLYNRGKTHNYEKIINFDRWKENAVKKDWKSNFKNDIPPIISNIRIKIKDCIA